MATCSKCHSDLPEDSESGRCPYCGHAGTGMYLAGRGMVDAVKAEIGYGPEKSWREQWGQVERSYKKVQDLYTDVVDSQEALMMVKIFSFTVGISATGS